MVWEKDVGFVRDIEVIHFVAMFQNGSDFLEKNPWVDDDTVSDDGLAFLIENATWKKMKGISHPINFN